MNPPRPAPRLHARRNPVLAIGIASLCALTACSDSEQSQQASYELYDVGNRTLPITVKEVAELQALRETVVRCEVEGNSTVIFMAPEGSITKQGDLLVKLDASSLQDKVANQAISVKKAEAARDQAEKSLEILEKELTAKTNTALSNLRIKEMELDKFLGTTQSDDSDESQGKNVDMVLRLQELVEPEDQPAEAAAKTGDEAEATRQPTAQTQEQIGPQLVAVINPRRYAPLVDKVIELLDDGSGSQQALERDMGDMANRVLQQVDRIRLAMADLKFQEAYYGHSRRLAARNFLTPNELEKDRIEFERRLSQVGLAWNDLDLLISYELFKDRIQLLQDVANARLELERIEASNDAERLRARTDLDSKKAEYDLAKERLDNLERQIRNADIYAPTPGLVIYAREERGRRNSESVREGSNVRERQELIVLPDTSQMQAIVKVQESAVNQVKVGQRAHIKVEAYVDRVFTGIVTQVAQQADSNSGWMSSDRKVYSTTIVLDEDNENGDLRSRMAAEVTILVDELQNVLAVPLQSVRRDRSVNYVWKHTTTGPVPTPVTVGRRNAEFVVIKEGLSAGDQIHLAIPRGAQPPNLPQPEVAIPEVTSNPEAGGQTTQPATESPDNGNARRPRGPGGQGGSGGMNMTDEQREQFTRMRTLSEQIKQFLLQKYPDRKEEIEDRRRIRQLYEDPDVKAALESELSGPWRDYSEMMEQMRARFGGGPGGGSGGSGGGSRGRRGS
jgi:HlyD family secretion protein